MVEGLTYIEDLVPKKCRVQFFALQFFKVASSPLPVAGWSSGSSSGS